MDPASLVHGDGTEITATVATAMAGDALLDLFPCGYALISINGMRRIHEGQRVDSIQFFTGQSGGGGIVFDPAAAIELKESLSGIVIVKNTIHQVKSVFIPALIGIRQAWLSRFLAKAYCGGEIIQFGYMFTGVHFLCQICDRMLCHAID